MRRPSAVGAATYALLAGIVAAGLALRVWNIDHGRPFVFNVDEASHFARRAVTMLARGTLDPGYYQNPSAFTYLVYAAVRLALDEGEVVRRFATDPTQVVVVGRAVAALLGVAGAVAAFALGRRLWDAATGLVAAAIVAFAFLPVAFSRLALTDVGTLAPVAVAVLGSVLALERGSLQDFALAGVGAGLAAGFKYTAGLVLVALLAAGVLRWRAERGREPLVGLAVGAVAAAGAFLVTTPFVVLELATASRQLGAQATAAGEPKLGQAGDSPVAYYLDSLTWGLGWVPALAAAIGAVVVARREAGRAVVLLAFPLALFGYLSTQERFFGRWLLPAYPVLAVLAAVALVTVAAWLARLVAPGRARWLAPAILAALAALTLAQPLAADWRSGRVLGREDTRALARAWLASHYPPNLRVTIEPEVPPLFFRQPGVGPPLFRRDFELVAKARGLGYSDTLSPATLDRYRATGTCLVVTLGYVRGRVERDEDPDAAEYYGALERESRVLWRALPQRAGAEPLRFHFDLSYNGYPPGLERPGPEVRILRLDRCRQRFGPLSPDERRAVAGE